jgi:hypothetical protein
MLLTSVVGHPPFEISRVGTAFIRLGTSLEDHVRMFLLKESREAKPCSYFGYEDNSNYKETKDFNRLPQDLIKTSIILTHSMEENSFPRAENRSAT